MVRVDLADLALAVPLRAGRESLAFGAFLRVPAVFLAGALVLLARPAACFRAVAAGRRRRPAFALAMDNVLSNLDSVAISVVLSDAYRDSTEPGGGGRPLTNSPEIDRQEDAQGMANVESENTPGPARGGAAVAESRNERGGLKVRPRDDDDQLNPA